MNTFSTLFGRIITALVFCLTLSINSHAAEDQTISVSTVALESLLNYQTRSFPATIVSENTAKVSAKINAEIVSLPLLVGDQASAGQTIAVLDCDIYKLETEAAKAALDLAAEDLSRIKELKNKSVVSAQQYTTASVARRQASVQYKQAELRTRYCEVKAPFTGVITKRLAALGDFAASGMPLLELVQTDKTEVKALLPVDVADSVATENELYFTQASTQVAITLRSVLPVIDEMTKTREARFSLASPLVPGSFGRLTWKSSSKVLPADMLQIRDGKSGLFITENNQAVFHLLPNATIGKPVVIDLPDNTLVITTGRHSMVDGQKIKIQ